MAEFILEFIRNDPKIVLMIFALLVTTFGVSLAVTVRKINASNRFLNKLEADSLYQIDENLGNVERLLAKVTATKVGSNNKIILRDAIDEYPSIPDLNVNEVELEKLSKHFADLCANLDKYNDNVMARKGFCMRYQELGNFARRMLSLFEKSKFSNISLEFGKLHLKQAGIIQ